MAMRLSLNNILKFTGYITPFLLTFYLIMTSVINNDVKALIYLAGILITLFLNKSIFVNLFKSPVLPDAAESCNLFSSGVTVTQYNSPAFNSVFMGFTMIYLILPMINLGSPNVSVILFLVLLFLLDAITKLTDKCTTISGVVLGLLIGGLFGAIWFTLLDSLGYKDLLYFSETTSRGAVCSRPSKQQFKCKVKTGTSIG
tara:strand:+ start:703 stop:1302 length:600 start_codon:yes stop_codon:yes gene_type:complete